MKNDVSKRKNLKDEQPVREGTPGSIADDKTKEEKQQYPFPAEKDKQLKDQPEFIDPGSNSSANE